MPSRSRSRSRSPEYASSSRRQSSRSPSRRSSDRKESRHHYNDDDDHRRTSSSRHRDDRDRDRDDHRTRDRDRDDGRRSSRYDDRHDDSRRQRDRDDRERLEEKKESSSRRRHSRDRERDRSRERTSSSRRDREKDAERPSSSSRHSHRRRRSSESPSGSDRDKEDGDDNRRRGRSSNSKKDEPSTSSSSRHKKSKRETSEERAARKAARKKEKEELNKTVEMALSNYSNADNPFNDANLGQKFVWAKKREVEKKQGISKAESARRDAERREEAMRELEKLNRKRVEREREREEREEELQRIQRMSEQAQLGDWQAKEDEFHLEQAKRRAEIRIKNNRAKPIDILAINVKMISEDKSLEELDEEDEDDLDFEIEVEEPYTIFENLSLEEVEELHQDIKFYLSLDKHESSKEFWRSMLIVCDDKLAELKRRPDEKSVVAPRIVEDITRMLNGKSLEQLQLLQGQFRAKLNSGGAIEVEYWETALKILIVWIAKVKLQQMHHLVLEKRLEQLKRRQQREAQKETAQLAAVMAMQSQEVHGDTSLFDHPEEQEDQEDSGMLEDEQAVPADMVYDRSMSPEPLDRLPEKDASLEVVDPDEDWQQVVEQRRRVMLKQFNPKKRTARQDNDEEHPDDAFVAKVMYEKEAAKNVGGPMEVEGDETNTFNTDAPLQQQTYMWQDKYRPRKPRFFNRVHTGYEWNKYNQTHYDYDNPPPKIVQGYKFNIFYPDLIDKSKAPTYVIEREPGNNDTVLIRFKAGPPYEDIAFRVVNREWEHSHKRGFKSVFDRGVLQLHFNFKRQFYRR